MKLLKKIRRYYLYCGIEKDEYNELKKDAYVSNFEVWRILHFIMFVVFFTCGTTSYISFNVVSIPVWMPDKQEQS